MKHSKPHKYYGRWLPQVAGTLVFAGFAGTLFALSEILENDTDNDGWTDAEEIIAGTNPADETDPWDSDGDGIADYLEFLDGSDPLDPFDPPQTRSVASVMNAVAPTDDEAENTSDSTTNILSLPAPTWSSQQNMWHNTAWFGQVLNYTFYTPSESSAWKAYAGTEIEYWSPGYYELSARNGSYGIVITLDDVSVGSYTLKWKHLERPDDGTANYTALISGTNSVETFYFIAPECESVGDVEEASQTFTVMNPGTLQISFVPEDTTNTKGPLVGSFELREVISLSEVNLDAGEGGMEFSVTQDNGDAFTGSDWVLSRNRRANPVAFQSGSKLKIVPTFRLPDSTVPSRIQAVITFGGSTNTYTLARSEHGNGIEIPAPVPAGTVGYFESATIVWKVSYAANSEDWEEVGTSTHEVYFTRSMPLTSLRQETLFSISCKQASGLSDPTAVVDAIYAEFTDLDVRRVSDGKQMTYWGRSNSDNYTETPDLLSMADGNCQAWSSFLRDLIRFQGIEANQGRVLPLTCIQGSDIPEYMMIKNWAFTSSCHELTLGASLSVRSSDEDGNESYIYVDDTEVYTHYMNLVDANQKDGDFAYPLTTVKGQGGTHADCLFPVHFITISCGFYYDPSYEHQKSSISDNGISYENIAFSGYFFFNTAFDARKNPENRLDVEISLWGD